MERYASVFITQYIIKNPDGLKGTMSNSLMFWNKHKSNLSRVKDPERRPRGHVNGEIHTGQTESHKYNNKNKLLGIC